MKEIYGDVRVKFISWRETYDGIVDNFATLENWVCSHKNQPLNIKELQWLKQHTRWIEVNLDSTKSDQLTCFGGHIHDEIGNSLPHTMKGALNSRYI